MLFAAGVITSLLVVGWTWWTLDGGAASERSLRAATTEPPLRGASLPIDWARAPQDQVLASGAAVVLSGVDHGPEGFLAVGFSLDVETSSVAALSGRGTVLTSLDGVVWRDAANGADFRGAALQSVVIAPRATVLGGLSGDEGPAFWFRRRNTNWQRAELESGSSLTAATVSSVATWDDGFVAVGGGLLGSDERAGQSADVWTSDDGAAWVERRDEAFVGFEAHGTDATAVGSDLIVVGVRSDDGGEATPTVWRFTSELTVAERIDLEQAAPEGVAGVSAVTGGERGVVAAGFDGDAAAVWLSQDGRAWEPIAAASFAADGWTMRIHDVIEVPAGFVMTGAMMGGTEIRRATWVSSDARDWSRLDLDERLVLGAATSGYALADDGTVTVVVGAESDAGPRSVAAAWVSPPPPGVPASKPIVPAARQEASAAAESSRR